jgi:hypothetical protein
VAEIGFLQESMPQLGVGVSEARVPATWLVSSEGDCAEAVEHRADVVVLDVPAIGGVGQTLMCARRLREAMFRPRLVVALIPADEADLGSLVGKADLLLDREAGEVDTVRLSNLIASAVCLKAAAPPGVGVVLPGEKAERPGAAVPAAPFWMDPEEFDEIRRQASLPDGDPNKRD